MKVRHSIIALTAVSGLLAGCDRYPDQEVDSGTGPAEVKEEFNEAFKATGEMAEDAKDRFVESMNAKLDQLEAEAAELADKSKSLQDEARNSAENAIRDLKAESAELRRKLEALKESSGQAWNELKKGFDGAMDQLEKAFDEARKKLD